MLRSCHADFVYMNFGSDDCVHPMISAAILAENIVKRASNTAVVVGWWEVLGKNCSNCIF